MVNFILKAFSITREKKNNGRNSTKDGYDSEDSMTRGFNGRGWVRPLHRSNSSSSTSHPSRDREQKQNQPLGQENYPDSSLSKKSNPQIPRNPREEQYPCRGANGRPKEEPYYYDPATHIIPSAYGEPIADVHRLRPNTLYRRVGSIPFLESLERNQEVLGQNQQVIMQRQGRLKPVAIPGVDVRSGGSLNELMGGAPTWNYEIEESEGRMERYQGGQGWNISGQSQGQRSGRGQGNQGWSGLGYQS